MHVLFIGRAGDLLREPKSKVVGSVTFSLRPSHVRLYFSMRPHFTKSLLNTAKIQAQPYPTPASAVEYRG